MGRVVDTAGASGGGWLSDSCLFFSCSARFTRRRSSYDMRTSAVLSGKCEGSGASPTVSTKDDISWDIY